MGNHSLALRVHGNQPLQSIARTIDIVTARQSMNAQNVVWPWSEWPDWFLRP